MSEENRTEIVQLAVSPGEKEIIDKAAKVEMRSVSNFIRLAIFEKIKEKKEE